MTAFSDEQKKNAAIIREVGKRVGASDRDILIALMTAMQESNLTNVHYGDRDSLGLFQQRAPWGSDAQRMDPYESARMFFQGGHTGEPGLFSKKNRDSMSLTQAAQAVQVSAFPDAYAKHESGARALMGDTTTAAAYTGGSGSVTSPPRDKLSWKEMAEEYSWNAAYVKAHPDLKALFDRASAEGMDQTEFDAALKQTAWYRDNSVAYNKAQRMQAEQPKEWAVEVERQTQKILDAAGLMGARLSPAQAKKIASNAFTFGWNDAQIQNTLGGYVNELKNSDHYGGQAGKDEMAVRGLLSDYGIKMTQSTIGKWVSDIAVGNKTIDDVKGWVQTQAELAFPSYEKQIKSGMTVKDIASSYTQQMADTLELNPDTIDLHDKTIRNALSYKDAKGQPTTMSLTDFERSLRSDARWRKTKNARDEVSNTAMQVLQDFGFRA